MGLSSRVWSFALPILVSINVYALSINDVYTTSYVNSLLSYDILYLGTTPVNIGPSSIQVNAVINNSVSDQGFFPNANLDYCNVTFAYTHTGRNDSVLVTYWVPALASFKNRYLATGGGEYAINSGTGNSGSLPAGVIYGADAGATDGGSGSFSNN